MNNEKAKNIYKIIWIVILIFLWIAFPFFPGDILFWMWLAIFWSLGGGVIAAIFFMGESKKNEKLIGIIWVIILVILWILYPFLPGYTILWLGIAIIWSIIGAVLAIGLFIIRRRK